MQKVRKSIITIYFTVFQLRQSSICKALRSYSKQNLIKIKKILAHFAVKKSTKSDKQDIAYAPFHNKQNVCKSNPIALQNFSRKRNRFVF